MTAIPGLNTLRNILSEKVATVIPRDVFHPVATTILVDRIVGAEAKDPLTEYLTKHKCILHAMLKEIRGENDKADTLAFMHTSAGLAAGGPAHAAVATGVAAPISTCRRCSSTPEAHGDEQGERWRGEYC